MKESIVIFFLMQMVLFDIKRADRRMFALANAILNIGYE